MMKDLNKPIFKGKVTIQGSCLFLMGPIGTFFSRLLKYLDDNNVETYKVLFPLHEYGFPKSKIIRYSEDIVYFKEFLRKIILEKKNKTYFYVWKCTDSS